MADHLRRACREIASRSVPVIKKVAEYSFAAAFVVCGVLWLVRLFYRISWTKPWLIVTTGWEEEALFSIWKFTQGQPVYNNPLQIPYSASFFNWGFYVFYGSVAKFWLTWLHLDAVWLPTICRLVTLFLGLVICGLIVLTLREMGQLSQKCAMPMVLAWSFIPIISPLCGYWVITARPDIGACMFELGGLVLVLRYANTRKIGLIVLAGLAFYAAWSFKQVAVSVLASSCLSLLLLKEGRALIILACLWWFLVLFTVWAGGDFYRYCLLESQKHCGIIPGLGLENFHVAILRDPFLIVPLVALGYLGVKGARGLFSTPVELILLLTSFMTLLLELLLASKVGAGENYFIPFAVWFSLWVVLQANRISPKLLQITLILTSLAMMVKVGLIFGGSAGYFDPRHASRPYEVLSEKLTGLPGPTLVTSRYGNLPWIQRRPPYFVLASTYDLDDRAGVKFEGGGWQGLMEKGYFRTVVTGAGEDLAKPLLSRYELISADENFRYYRRKD